MAAKKAKNLKDTEKIAQEFLNALLRKSSHGEGATVIGLSGELGAGKTTFTQAVGKHLGIRGKMRSPTFVIIKKYPLRNNPQFKYLFHLDAYRLKNEKELLYLGWQEIIKPKDHLVLIEWPENVAGIMPKKARQVRIRQGEKKERHFDII